LPSFWQMLVVTSACKEKAMRDPIRMNDRELLEELVSRTAELICMDKECQPGYHFDVTGRASSLRQELLYRMGGEQANEGLLDRLVSISANAIVEMTSVSDEVREMEADLTKQVLQKIIQAQEEALQPS